MRKKMIIWTLLIAMLVGMAGCGIGGALSGEEFTERMEKIGYIGDGKGLPASLKNPTALVMYNVQNDDGYRATLSVFDEQKSAEACFELWVQSCEQSPAGVEIEEKTDTYFLAWYKTKEGEKVGVIHALVDNTVLQAEFPESETKNIEKALRGTGYLK